MEEMRQRIGRGDKDQEIEETIQVCLRCYCCCRVLVSD